MIQTMHILAASTSIGDTLSKFFRTAKEGFETLGPVGGIILAVIVFIVGRMVAGSIRGLIVKALNKTEIDNKLASMLGHESGVTKGIANFVYCLLLLFVVIIALGFAKMDKISGPLQDMLSQFLNFIPNVLGAGILLYVVLMVAKLVKQLAAGVLDGAKLDERLGSKPGEKPVSSSLTTALYCFIILLFTPAVLEFLKIDSVSRPVGDVVDSILSSVPNIIIASILIAVGVVIGQIARKLVTNLLDAAGANQWPAKIGLDVPTEGKSSLSNVVGLVVMISVAVVMVSAAIKELKIDLLSDASVGFVGLYFNIVLAAIILGAGILFSKYAYKNLADKNITLAKVIRAVIIVVATVVALDRTGLAPELTGLPYQFAIYALATAFGIGGAIAIGLGGKDYVARFLERKG